MECVGLEVDESLVFGSDVEIVEAVFGEGGDEVAGEFRGLAFVGDEAVFFPVVAVESSASGAYPDLPLSVFGDVGDEVIGDAEGVAGVVAVDGDLVAIVFVESVAGTEPHEATAVLQDAEDIILREPGVDIQMLELQIWLLCQCSDALVQQKQKNQQVFCRFQHWLGFQSFFNCGGVCLTDRGLTVGGRLYFTCWIFSICAKGFLLKTS